MTTFHAIVWLDHTEAHVLGFDREHVQSQRVKSRSHHKASHQADAGYFIAIAGALAGAHEVLLTGPASAKDEFRTWCKSHMPQVAQTIVDVVPSDHPSDAQLVALARKYFLKYDQIAADPSRS